MPLLLLPLLDNVLHVVSLSSYLDLHLVQCLHLASLEVRVLRLHITHGRVISFLLCQVDELLHLALDGVRLLCEAIE